jgi:hypothetical protein
VLRPALTVGVIATALACASAPSPGPAAPPGRRTPVVLVPGITGTELVDRTTGEIQWGTGKRLLCPRDRGYRLMLPPAPDPASRLRPARAIAEIRLLGGLARKPIYQPVIDAFASAGWVPGDLTAPRPGETFLTFPYDWRQDVVRSAGELLAGLERLRRVRGEPTLRVDLVCQSSGAHLCRYLVKHGGASLEDVEAGRAGLPPEIDIRRLALVGASNGGSLRIFAFLHQGRRYLPGGRFFSPESLFTYRSLFQDLPVDADGLFLDSAGQPLAVDLYDPAAWVEHGWSVFAPGVARRLDEHPLAELGSPQERRELLRRRLADARRFQAALAADRDLGATRYLLVQSNRFPTMHRAVLERTDGGWRTRFGPPGAPGSRRLRALVNAPGDEHATLASQNALAPGELAALAGPPRRSARPHFEMIVEPATLAWLVSALAADEPRIGATQ